MDISVIIRNRTPFFSAAPGQSSISLDGVFNPPGGGFPLTRARTMMVAIDSGEGVISQAQVPVVPGNTMRNLLRRIMLNELIKPALESKTKISIGAYAALYSGSASGNPEGKSNTLDDMVALRSDPFIGLFGGGPRMLEGRLMTDSMYPIHANTARVIGEGYEERMISGKITDVVWTRRVDPISRMKEDEDVKIIEGGANAVNAWVTDLLEKKSAKGKAKKEPTEEEPKASARGLDAFNAHEVVIPGISWVWRLSLDRPTDAQIGLVLSAISQLPKYAIAGGHAKNYGQCALDDVQIDSESVWLGSQYDEQVVTPYVDALTEELDSMDGSLIERFVGASA